VGGTKDPDVAAIVALRPDLVVLCVEENRREDADALTHAGVTTAALSIDGVADVAPALRSLADLVGVDPARVEEMDADPLPGDKRLRAFVPIWKRPWMSLAGGTYGSSLLAAIGVDNVFADAADRYPTVTLDAARARNPDVVLAPSEPYPFRERHIPLLEDVAPVVLVDGQDLFWWGVRTPRAAERLRRQLRP
jgi:ABC-type Fe3+-hydroxamate transport system substrate-binding protein